MTALSLLVQSGATTAAIQNEPSTYILPGASLGPPANLIHSRAKFAAGARRKGLRRISILQALCNEAHAAKSARLSIAFGENQQKSLGLKMIFSKYAYPVRFQ